MDYFGSSLTTEECERIALLPKSPGIYAIVHVESQRRYIGSAKSLHERWREHRRALKGNRHHNRKLQNSWNKNGERSFAVEVIEHVENISLLIEREQFWIDALAPHYNIAPTAGSVLGFRHSEETKARWRQERKGKNTSPECYSAMHDALKTMPDDWWRSRGELVAAATAKTYQFISPEGALVQVTNLARFCRDNDLVQGRMRELWRGVRVKQHHGWRSGKVNG